MGRAKVQRGGRKRQEKGREGEEEEKEEKQEEKLPGHSPLPPRKLANPS